MVVAGVVIETRPGRAAAVASRLGTLPGLEVRGDDGDRRIAAVWSGESGEVLEEMAEALLADDGEVLGVLPTFAGEVHEG